MLVAIVICFIVIAILLEWLHYNTTKPLPGPWGFPLVYSLPTMIRATQNGTMLKVLDSFRASYGRSFQIRVPGLGKGPYVISTYPQDSEYVLQTNFDNYPKASFMHPVMEPLMGRGIFSVDGHEWLVQRKAASLAFRITDIKNSVTVFKRVAQDLVSVLDASENKEIDVQVLFASATLSGFCEAALSMHLVDVSEKESDFAFHFNRLQRCINLRFGNPFYPLLPFSQMERELRESAAYLNTVAHSAIKSARSRDADHPADMLTPFLEMDGATDVYLRDVLMSLLVAGRDTTSQTLTWCFWSLATHPEAQERLYAEVIEALPGDTELEWRQHTDGKLPYLNAVIKETLRIYPPVPSDLKAAVKDDVLPSGAIIRAGSTFDWWQWGMSREPSLFEDPLKFKPERWLENPKDPNIPPPPTSNRPPWIPFQFGPRVCLGKRMAESDLETVIALLVKTFRFLPGSKIPVPTTAITLAAMDGVFVIPQRRKQ